MNTAKRLAIILLAYALSSLVTGYVVWAFQFLDGKEDVGLRNPGFGLFIALLVAWFASVPAGLTVLVGEAKDWRMWWYYSAAGSFIGLVLGMIFNMTWFFPWLGLGFGPVSGGIYWAIAGRRSGAEDAGERRAILIAMGAITLLAALFTVPLMTGVR